MPINKSNYPANWREIALRIRKLRKYTCEFCFKGRIKKNPFTVHHLDQDSWNNRDDNLVLLHSSCHLLFHSTFRSCKLRKEFDEIVKNVHSQMKFSFATELDKIETAGRFIQYKIKQRWREKKCLKNSLAENSSSLSQQASQTS